jgi:hypothetical protein
LSDYLSLFVPSICSSLLFYILVRHRSLSPPLAFNYGGAKFSLAPQNSCRGLATQASLFTSLRTTFLKLAISAYNNYTYLSWIDLLSISYARLILYHTCIIYYRP